MKKQRHGVIPNFPLKGRFGVFFAALVSFDQAHMGEVLSILSEAKLGLIGKGIIDFIVMATHVTCAWSKKTQARRENFMGAEKREA
ncbi:MAG: hypothetical protein R2778_07025 [Saprospiraceae bacterium]